jgi:hypothetical protein
MRTVTTHAYTAIIAAALILTTNHNALGLDGYYMGQWASDQNACEAKASPDRVILLQTDVLTPQFHCKLLGIRADDASGTTFMANCNDPTTRWNDEVTMRADKTNLILKLKSDGQQKQFIRCNIGHAKTKQ